MMSKWGYELMQTGKYLLSILKEALAKRLIKIRICFCSIVNESDIVK